MHPTLLLLTNVTITQIAVTLFLGAAVFLLIFALFRYPVPTEPPLHRRIALAVGLAQRNTLFENPVVAPIMAMMLALARRFSMGAIRDSVRRNLNASGNPNNYSVEEYLALCLFTGLCIGLITLIMSWLYLGTFEPFAPLVLGCVGFGVPLWALSEQAARRVARINKKLPYTLDLIALMMAAGSTFTEAVETLIRDEPDDDFNQELRIVQAEIEFGAPRSQALQNMADRIPLESLRSVVGAVNQAEALGTPLSAILKAQSGMMRMHRSVRAEKLSASASLRILIPSMVILLAVVLVVFGPFLVRAFDSWMSGKGFMFF